MPRQVTQVKSCHLQKKKKQGESSLNEKKKSSFPLFGLGHEIHIFFSAVTHQFPCESSRKWKRMPMTSLQHLSDWSADDGTANPLLRHSVVSHT